jgi:hypothetical protein
MIDRGFRDPQALRRGVTDRWVLKGATAMLVRLGSASRHTRDVDLYSESGDLDDAEAALRVAAAQDVGDFFRFELGPGTAVGGVSRTRRIRVTASLGATRFASFPVDLVTNLNMTSTPEILGPPHPDRAPRDCDHGVPRVPSRRPRRRQGLRAS